MTTLTNTVELTRSDLNRTYGGTRYITVGDRQDGKIIEVGLVEQVITIDASIGNAGMLYVENFDAANYVDIGYATGNYPNRIYPGEIGQIPLSPTTSQIFVKADTAAVRMEYLVTERP